jgi:hypothetical protein
VAPSVAGGETLCDNGHFVGESYVFKPNILDFFIKNGRNFHRAETMLCLSASANFFYIILLRCWLIYGI